ncbi:hypothetical protein LVJ94_12865 [Pendulispora rubella]|uniref:Uncharacterized protein n=1 Tax=Pendulispora rubella TaxID=2741070 RepID=A0ABZ2LBF6_9BACT
MGQKSTKAVPRVLAAMAILVMATASCRAGGWVASVVGDVVGSKGDVACDRRYGEGPEADPAGFCQEVIDTVAVSQVGDDCRDNQHAHSIEGRCPREGIIGGCKLSITNDDGSEVYDWYYDVSDLERAKNTEFESSVKTVDEVRAKCADRSRYDEGAEFVEP